MTKTKSNKATKKEILARYEQLGKEACNRYPQVPAADLMFRYRKLGQEAAKRYA